MNDGALRFQSPNSTTRCRTDSGTDNIYNVTVKVTDNGNPAMDATRSVTLTITNVNETPRDHVSPEHCHLRRERDRDRRRLQRNGHRHRRGR